MYVVREDAVIVNSEEVWQMREQYERKFGERYISFNYIDFQGVQGVPGSAGQQYKDMLEEALKKDKPTRIVSHRKETEHKTAADSPCRLSGTPISPV